MEQLLEKYLPTAEAVVRRRMSRALRSREESLDLVQSACRRAIEQKDRYDHESDEHFRAWLLEIVQNKIVDRYRGLSSAKRDARREVRIDSEAHDEDVPEEPSGASPSAVAARNEEVQAVKDAIERLPPELAETIRLHAFEAMSYPVLAEHLELTPKQARLRVLKARVALARLLRVD